MLFLQFGKFSSVPKTWDNRISIPTWHNHCVFNQELGFDDPMNTIFGGKSWIFSNQFLSNGSYSFPKVMSDCLYEVCFVSPEAPKGLWQVSFAVGSQLKAARFYLPVGAYFWGNQIDAMSCNPLEWLCETQKFAPRRYDYVCCLSKALEKFLFINI